jgi:putative SOS response-associated peptidase YedK
MCGRFTRLYTWWQIWEMYNLFPSAPNLEPRYNICPTTTVDVVICCDNQRVLVPMRWGLIPAWWKKPLKEMRLATFNARAETIAEKSMFRDSFQRRRCLMPVSGYYEWADTPAGKQPYYFTRRDGQTMTVAAIQDGWVDPTTHEAIRSCSMVITEPNKVVAEVHDRMPVILEGTDFEQWERGDVKDAAALTKPANEEVLQKWPVSKRVNSSRASDDDATLIDKIGLPE